MRWVLRPDLKAVNDDVALKDCGREFQTDGAQWVNERSANLLLPFFGTFKRICFAYRIVVV